MYEPIHSEASDSNGEHATGEAGPESLRQHLANEARVSCPQGRANCSLAHAAGNAREQQAREIGTHDKEHSHNRGKQKDQSMARWSDDFPSSGWSAPGDRHPHSPVSQFVTGPRSVQRAPDPELRRV